MPRGAHAVEIAEVKIVLEEELGDRARRPGIDLGLEHVDIGCDRRAVGMFFRIGRDRHFDIGDAPDAGDEIGGVAIAVRDAAHSARRRRRADRRAARRCGGRRPHIGAITSSISARVAATQVRCAAGVSVVSARMRLTVAWVRSRVDPPAP